MGFAKAQVDGRKATKSVKNTLNAALLRRVVAKWTAAELRYAAKIIDKELLSRS